MELVIFLQRQNPFELQIHRYRGRHKVRQIVRLYMHAGLCVFVLGQWVDVAMHADMYCMYETVRAFL